jgi:hypothetical protein
MTQEQVADLHAKIMDLLDEGLKPVSVSAILDVPLEMVYDAVEQNDEYQDDIFVVYDEESEYGIDE